MEPMTFIAVAIFFFGGGSVYEKQKIVIEKQKTQIEQLQSK